MPVGLLNLFLGGKPGSAVLTVTHGAALDSVQGVVVCQKRKAADDEKHYGGRGDQNSYFFLHEGPLSCGINVYMV